MPYLYDLVVLPVERALCLGRDATPESGDELPEAHQRHRREREDDQVNLIVAMLSEARERGGWGWGWG